MDAEMRKQLEDILDVAGGCQSSSDVSNALDHACATIKTVLGMEEPDKDEAKVKEHPKCECGSTEFERCLECVDVHTAILYERDYGWEVEPNEFVENYQPDSHEVWLRCAKCGDILADNENVQFQ